MASSIAISRAALSLMTPFAVSLSIGRGDIRLSARSIFMNALPIPAEPPCLVRLDSTMRPYSRTLDFDPGSETFHAGEDGAAFVARYGTDGTFAETARRLQAFEQRPPFPNPFRESATWHLRVEHPQPVRIELFDMLGRSVGTVYQGFLQAGVPAEIPIQGRGLSPGVYVLRAVGSGFTTSQVIIRL